MSHNDRLLNYLNIALRNITGLGEDEYWTNEEVHELVSDILSVYLKETERKALSIRERELLSIIVENNGINIPMIIDDKDRSALRSLHEKGYVKPGNRAKLTEILPTDKGRSYFA